MMIMMSTTKSQLLALLTFLVVLLLSGVQALVTQFINTTISGAVFGRQLVYDVRCIQYTILYFTILYCAVL